MTIGAVPPAKRHGAGPGHHFGIICKRDRRPRARQLSRAGFVVVVRSRNDWHAAVLLLGPCSSPAEQSRHSVTCAECRDCSAGHGYGLCDQDAHQQSSLCIPRRRLKPLTTQPSSSRRPSGADATATATAVAGEVSELGRVPSGPWLGPTGTAGPENRISTFMSELLAQRAVHLTLFIDFFTRRLPFQLVTRSEKSLSAHP